MEALYREIHCLAQHYHWEESGILGLTHARRRRYLALIEQDADARLLADAR